MALFLQEFFFHKKRFHQIITRGILEGHDLFFKAEPVQHPHFEKVWVKAFNDSRKYQNEQLRSYDFWLSSKTIIKKDFLIFKPQKYFF